MAKPCAAKKCKMLQNANISQEKIPDISEIPDIEDPWCVESNPRTITFEGIQSAVKNLEPYIQKTHCDLSRISQELNMEIYIKKEYLHYTGSYKERGALNAMLEMTPEERTKGVIAASAGNHAQGVCYHGFKLGIPVTTVMPVTAPLNKINKCRDLHGNVVIAGKNLCESKKISLYLGQQKGLTYINGYDHPNVLKGAGTVGVEIIEQVPDVEVIVVPVGGGGLLAGVSTAMKQLKPDVTIIAAESERTDSFSVAFRNGKPTHSPVGATLADGLAVPMIGYNSFQCAMSSGFNIKSVVVKESWIAAAILKMLELEKCILEGAGAIGIAAILSGQLDEYKNKKIVVVTTGGNIDSTILSRCINRGLILEGRVIKFIATICDTPDCIAEVCSTVAKMGAGVKDMSIERGWTVDDVFHVKIKMDCETRNMQHALELKKILSEKYKECDFNEFK